MQIMSTSSQKAEQDELIELDHISSYGSSADEEIPTKSLEDIYKIIGNRSQNINRAWFSFFLFLFNSFKSNYH